MNLYTYCHNEPIKYIDPTGHVVSEADKKNLTLAQQNAIQRATDAYNSAPKGKEGDAQRAAAHAAAEAIRASAGYSGGTDGSGYKPTNTSSGGSSGGGGSVSKGSTGSDVLAVQFLLNAYGYNIVADGSFGPLTQAAVKEYQLKMGLQVDGVVGPKTSASLGVSITATKATNQVVSANNSVKPSIPTIVESPPPTVQQYVFSPNYTGNTTISSMSDDKVISNFALISNKNASFFDRDWALESAEAVAKIMGIYPGDPRYDDFIIRQLEIDEATMNAVGVAGGSIAKNVVKSSTNNVQSVSKEIIEWLGANSKVIINASGDKVFLSKDGLRKVRFDFNNTSPHSNPHMHIEKLVNGKWKAVDTNSKQIYPIDVPHI